MNIDKLRSVGDDALLNLYKVVIPPFAGGTFTEDFAVRVENFVVPEFTHESYEVVYRGQKVMKTSGVDPNIKETTFTLRIDKNWEHYNAIKAWKFATYNPIDGVIGEGSILGVPITVLSVDSNDTPTGGVWVFENARVKTLAGVTFDNATGDPVKCDITIEYDNMY